MKGGEGVSIRIKVSYTEDNELAAVIKLLTPMVKSYKIRMKKRGYKLAYIDVKTCEKDCKAE